MLLAVSSRGERMKKTISFRMLAIVNALLMATFLATFLATSAFAQMPKETSQAHKRAPRPAAGASAQAAAAPLTKEDLETFLDGFMPIELQQDDIAGAVVCVVKDGKVVLEKGYGFADVKARKPVTPDATLFRPGSISKTFTWTAVMQLMEQGKLDLNRDVNDYIDFKIPATFGKPITLKDIMTHTPGFEEAIKELFVANSSDMRPLDVYLKTHLPEEIFPPGTTPAYSNYAATLAGYIVQRVSGMPFDDYIEKNIFQPLAMSRTTFRQPLPENLEPMMSNGYQKASGEAKGFEYVAAWPAGSVSTTADNMSHWMIAHLQNGEYNGARILKPETAQLMHSRLWTNLPELNGGDYGFYEQSLNGRRSIGHGGDTQWFHSDMHLLVDDNIGLFVSFNSAGKGELSVRDALWQHFMDRYFPYTPPAMPKLASTAGDIKSVTGTYWSSRRAQTNVLSVITLLSESKVAANSDGTISVSGQNDFAGNPKHFEEIAPMVFREVHGQEHIGFKKGWGGVEVMAYDFPFIVSQRAPLLKTTTLNNFAIVFAIVVFALTLLFWPISAMMRRHYNQRLLLSGRYRALRMVSRIACIVNLLFTSLFVAWGMSLENSIEGLSHHFDARLHLLQAAGLIGVILSFVSIYYCIRSWTENSLWIWTRIWNTLLLIACAGYVFFLLNWHMLNFHLNY
jgi:CubicO group peptidase (beta-lactamase class C family)